MRPVVHYGKWVTAAAAIGLTALAAREHDRSARAWSSLIGICAADNADCALGADGRYINPVSEQFYQRSLYYDGRARRRLLAGQIALVITATLFIADLGRGTSEPSNIPFEPNRLLVARASGGGTSVGWRLDF
jgi:hypothetical protein